MKKIMAVLAAVSVLGLGLFASCSDEEQDVNVVSNVKTNYAYLYDVSGTYTTTPTGGTAKTYTVDADSVAAIEWDTNTNSNYQKYNFDYGQVVSATASDDSTYSIYLYSLNFRKVGSDYYVGATKIDVSADPAYASEFSYTYTKESTSGTNTYKLTFKRK